MRTNRSCSTCPTRRRTTRFTPGPRTSPSTAGKYKVGWDVIREQRFERMKKMGIIGENHKLTPRASKAWDELSDKQKDEEDLKMAVYCAMIDRVDQNLGTAVRQRSRNWASGTTP